MKPDWPLSRFVIRVVLLLPVCFLAWHYLGAILVALPAWGAGELLTLWLPELVDGTSQRGTELIVATRFGELNGSLVPAEQAEFALGTTLDARLLSYAIPFYAALHFATPMEAPLERFARRLFLLWALILLGLVSMALKDLLVVLGDLPEARAALPPGPLVGIAYQFSVLIVPPVAPLVLWLWDARKLPVLAELLRPSTPPTPESRRPPQP